jgi:hypothetical protein
MNRRTLRTVRDDDLPAARVDQHTTIILDDAVDALAALRTTYWLADSAVHLHALVSLIAQAEQMLPDAVRQARDQDHTWTQIGQLLNLAPSTTAKRYRRTHEHLDTEDHPHNADERASGKGGRRALCQERPAALEHEEDLKPV